MVTGGSGLLGSSLLRILSKKSIPILSPNSDELDLTDHRATINYLIENQTDLVIHCAARVGGISANIKNPYPFLRDNLKIDLNVIEACKDLKIENFLYMGSSCMYPSNINRPMTEEDLMTGPLEETNKSYALAKLCGAQLVENVAKSSGLAWRTLILSNLYGPKDHFDSERSHLVAAIINKVYEAKINKKEYLEMWGTGEARREFTYVDDVADFISNNLERISKFPYLMNLGAGVDYSVSDYYSFVLAAFNYECLINPRPDLPSGMMRKLMNVEKAKNLGWNPKVGIQNGLERTKSFYLESKGVHFD